MTPPPPSTTVAVVPSPSTHTSSPSSHSNKISDADLASMIKAVGLVESSIKLPASKASSSIISSSKSSSLSPLETGNESNNHQNSIPRSIMLQRSASVDIVEPIPVTKAQEMHRKFASKVPNWLQYFYQNFGETSPKAIAAFSSLGNVCKSNASIASSSSSSHSSSNKKNQKKKKKSEILPKGILKKNSNNNQFVNDNGEKSVDSDSFFPQPIIKSTFLEQEELARMTIGNQNHYDSNNSQDQENQNWDYRHQNGKNIYNGNAGKEGNISKSSTGISSIKLSFNPHCYMIHTWSADEYDRSGIDYIAKKLTPELAMAIKQELNEVKMEMPIHNSSKKYTQLYQLR